MIIDKAYYDYEYDNSPKLKSNNLSDTELKNRLASLGIGTDTKQ